MKDTYDYIGGETTGLAAPVCWWDQPIDTPGLIMNVLWILKLTAATVTWGISGCSIKFPYELALANTFVQLPEAIWQSFSTNADAKR